MFKNLKEKFMYMGDFYLFLGILISFFLATAFISKNIPPDSILRSQVFWYGGGTRGVKGDFTGSHGLLLIFSFTFLFTVTTKLVFRFLKKPEHRNPITKDELYLLVFSLSFVGVILLFVLNQYLRLVTNTL